MSLVQQSNNRARRSIGMASGFGLGLAPTLLLDALLTDGVTSARSLNRLTAAARGPCLRARRKADDVLADVYFDDAGRVSMASPVKLVTTGAVSTLAAFHQGGSVAVVDHTDQSGRGPLGQAVPATAQPLLVMAGRFITNDGSPPVIGYDRVDDYSEWRFLRGPTQTVIVAGSIADQADAGAAFQLDGQAIGAPSASGAAIIPGNPGRQIFAGLSIGDGVSDRGKYRCLIAVFNSSQSAFYSNGALVAAGDVGASRSSNILIGKSAAGAFSNASYHTLITLDRALTAAQVAAVTAAVLGFS